MKWWIVLGLEHLKQLWLGSHARPKNRLSSITFQAPWKCSSSYTWTNSHSCRAPISQVRVRPIKASSTALPSYHCFPPSSWQANIRATGPHFALGPAIYPGARGTHGQSPNLFAFHCSFTRLPKLWGTWLICGSHRTMVNVQKVVSQHIPYLKRT